MTPTHLWDGTGKVSGRGSSWRFKHVPDHELHEARGTLMDCELEGFKVELEEDSGCPAVMVEDTGVVGHAVLVRIQRGRARSDVCGGDHMEEILVRDKCWSEGQTTITEY